MKANNAIYNLNRAKIKKTLKNKMKEYHCLFHCPIKINDYIISIDIIKEKVVFGTLMGDVYLCSADSKKLDINLTLENKRFTRIGILKKIVLQKII